MRLLYYLVLLPLSRLPQVLRNALSDFLAFVLYRVVGYRKKMILKNLSLCFPEKTESEHREICKGFYTNLGDIIMESIQGFSINEKQALKRISTKNEQLLDSLFEQGRSVILTGGHNANWEAITLCGHRLKHDIYALYKPLKNTFMDEKVKMSRERYGTKMISIKNFRPYFTELTSDPKLFIFGIDQSPRKGKGIWMEFLNRQSLVFTGPERLAKEYDMAVVMGGLVRVKRGVYTVEFNLLTNDPKNSPENEITIKSNRAIEDQIRKAPSDWLWSHNRWKHRPEDGEQTLS